MPSNRQKSLGFVKKFGRFYHIKGKGLISPTWLQVVQSMRDLKEWP